MIFPQEPVYQSVTPNEVVEKLPEINHVNGFKSRFSRENNKFEAYYSKEMAVMEKLTQRKYSNPLMKTRIFN